MPVPIISELNSSDQGAWREALVASDLIGRGFSVFPRWGAGGSPDMVIAGPKGSTARVEIKAECSQRRVRWTDVDMMAVVTDTKDIIYYWYDWDYCQKRDCDPVTWFAEHAICHAEIDRRLTALEDWQNREKGIFVKELTNTLAEILNSVSMNVPAVRDYISSGGLWPRIVSGTAKEEG
jgi:hypothetical protein